MCSIFGGCHHIKERMHIYLTSNIVDIMEQLLKHFRSYTYYRWLLLLAIDKEYQR